MALVDPSCFKALSPQEQAQQIYEATLDWANSAGKDTSSLTTADCFASLSEQDQVQQTYEALYLLNS